MNRTILLAICLAAATGCKDVSTTQPPAEPGPVIVTDAQLFQLITSSVKAAFYKNISTPFAGNSGPAHASKIFVWYNAVAATQLDGSGKVKAMPTFADSSLIVKQIYNAAGDSLELYAVMFKMSAAQNKAAGDWVWAELKPNGDPYFSATGNVQFCGACHSSGVAFTRMNDAHP